MMATLVADSGCNKGQLGNLVEAICRNFREHDEEDHFTFVQNDSEKKKEKVVQRNPHVYEGTYINVNRKKDGTLYPTFNRPQF